MARLRQGIWFGCIASALIAGAGCAPETGTTVEHRSGALAAGDPGNLDILFMVDNSSSMTSMQMKLVAQDPSFMKVLEGFPNGLPNLHVAIVSSDMGAPGDSTSSIGCTTSGDNGIFRSDPTGTCTSTTLASGATFISNVGGVANYTGKLEDVFSCVAVLGASGCGFEHQLASVARALGADGAPPPPENAGFLRPDAELAIILLTNEDDCSAPANTTLFGLNGGTQSITNPLGPIANYRCNQFGHLCNDPTSSTPNAFIAPPLTPPADASGNPPALNLTNCESNETSTSMLTSVSNFVNGIKALKANPADQIVVGAISPPVTPYTVEWVPPSSPPPGAAGEIWPQVEHSCGAVGGDDVNPLATQHSTDGTFGDPGVRIAQWVHGFGDNGVVTSICDADYGLAFQMIAAKIQEHLQPSSTGAGGAGGAAGKSGAAGAAGGMGGAAGHAGAAGGGGAAGSAGTAGGGGHGGVAGGSGVAGSGGLAGSSGVAGSSGAAGNGGTAGHAGAGGQAGGSGAAGSGVAGSSGTAGTTGAAGASAGGHGGTAGGGGMAGNTGAAGHAGSSVAGGSGAAGAGGGGGSSTVVTGTGGGAAGGAAGTGTGGTSASGGHAGSTAAGTGGHAGNAGATGGSGVATPSGCGCETSPGPASTWGLLPLAALFLTRRRRTPAKRP